MNRYRRDEGDELSGFSRSQANMPFLLPTRREEGPISVSVDLIREFIFAYHLRNDGE